MDKEGLVRVRLVACASSPCIPSCILVESSLGISSPSSPISLSSALLSTKSSTVHTDPPNPPRSDDLTALMPLSEEGVIGGLRWLAMRRIRHHGGARGSDSANADELGGRDYAGRGGARGRD